MLRNILGLFLNSIKLTIGPKSLIFSDYPHFGRIWVGSLDFFTLSDSLERLGVSRGDGILVHSSLALAFDSNFRVRPTELLANIERLVGDEGVVVLPSFSYSLPTGRVYDKADADSFRQMGTLPKVAFAAGYHRTDDPIFSFLLSRRSFRGEMLDPKFSNSFGTGSTMRKLIDSDFLVLNLGVHPASTLLHETEHRAKVPYRFEKTFHGERIIGKQKEKVVWTSYVRDLEAPKSEIQISMAKDLLSELHSYKWLKLGRHLSTSFRAKEADSKVLELLRRNPMALLEKK